MVIIDRSFSSLSQMAIHLFNGTIAEKLLKFGSCGWQTQNDFYAAKESFGFKNGEKRDSEKRNHKKKDKLKH